MLSIVIFISFFALTLSSKVGQPKDDLEDEKNIVLSHSTNNRNLRANNTAMAVSADLQLSIGLVNLIDAKTLNNIRSHDDYVRLRDKYQNIISQQRNIINEVAANLPTMKTKLSNNEAELLSINYNLDTVKNESSTLNEQLEELKRTRDYERQDFQEKLKDSRALILGIERTQENLREQAVGDDALNQVSVQHIMSLMKNTMESLEATMKNDIQAERQADKNYKDFLHKINQVLAQDKANLDRLNNRKSVLEPEIGNLRNKIKTDTFRRSQAEVLLAQAVTDLDELNRKYNNR
jgi:chromosome segregation ATPase